jgi:hypothetical protein
MYYPFLRGRGEELLALREIADIITQKNITPIIEPVSSFSEARIKSFSESGASFILTVNPRNSDTFNPSVIHTKFITGFLSNNDNYWIGFIITKSTSQLDIERLIARYSTNEIVYIHMDEFRNPQWLLTTLRKAGNTGKNIFLNGKTSVSYQISFNQLNCERVILNDAFQKKNRNADYPNTARPFSNIHLTFNSGGYDGFGDFTIVGNHLAEGGGKAHAVALHLTYLKPAGMNIRHFVSKTTDDSKNVAGKFEEAHEDLCRFIKSEKIGNTKGAKEYLKLSHYPGLGMPKRFSIMHHIETYGNVV